jgi:hypothetical protein
MSREAESLRPSLHEREAAYYNLKASTAIEANDLQSPKK